MDPRRAAAIAVLLAAAGAGAAAQTTPVPSRGELLYTTHCVACHNAQIHWRDKRSVGDWAGLLAMVRHWQAQAGLGWGDADIEEVARHLNRLYYRLPAGGERVGALTRSPRP